MPNRERVMCGLERHASDGDTPCIGCPYSADDKCSDVLAKEAMEVLTDQESRIHELEEKLRLLKYGDQDSLQGVMMPAT